MTLFIIGLVLLSLAIIGFVGMKQKQKKAETPLPVREHIITETVYPVDQENADRFFRFYKEDFDENDEYDLSAKELKEDYEGEKVYRYDPYQLDYKIEEGQIFAKLDDEWVHVARLKKTQSIPEDALLFLFPNVYKYVTEEEVSKETGDPFFGFEYKKKVGI